MWLPLTLFSHFYIKVEYILVLFDFIHIFIYVSDTTKTALPTMALLQIFSVLN